MGMRRGNDNAWMFDENDHMIAINLGADFTAEHEWGIKDLYRTLGIKHDESVLGIERYRVTLPHPESVILIEQSKNDAALIVVDPFDVRYLVGKKLDDISHGELSIYKDQDLATAWDGKSLGVRVKKPKNIKHLRRIHKAIVEKEAAVWLGGGHVFQNGGLVVGIINAIPEVLKKQMYDAHVDRAKLEKASEATGIKQKIDALKGGYYAPCGYYALSPAWFKNLGRGLESAHPVMYWLNPREQEKNQANWYTVEQLEQWMKGEGPVLKSNKVEVHNESVAVSS